MYPNVSDYSYGTKSLTVTSGSNTGTSAAAGTVGAITNSANIGFTLAAGTGITQNDPSGNAFSGKSELKFEVDGIWDITSTAYGPGYGYVAFSVGSTVPAKRWQRIGGGGSDLDETHLL